MSDESFFSRWSKRKRAAAAGRDSPTAEAVPAPAETPSATDATPIAATSTPPASEPPPLPEVSSLTPESDFTPFMSAEVDPATRRAALKTLFSDPRFNVMDGLDVYIDDYSKPDPLPEGWLDKLEQVKRLGIFREEEPPEAVRMAENGGAAGQQPAKPEAISECPPATGAESTITPETVRNPDHPKE
jgi:uncharacterized protein DUF3306